MNTLLENPFPIYAGGALLATFCGLVFLARRNLPSLLTLVGAVLLTLVLIITERMVVTDAEEIQVVTETLMVALERNDVPGVIAAIDPAATEVRSHAETLMPLVRVSDTGAASIQVVVDATAVPLAAVSEFHAKVDGIHTRSGMRLFYFDKVLMNWTKKEGRWLLTDYTPMHQGRPISAVESVRENRPVSR